jgi:hypothetical protein
MGCYDGGGSNKSLFGAKNLQIGVKSMWYGGGDKKMVKRKKKNNWMNLARN